MGKPRDSYSSQRSTIIPIIPHHASLDFRLALWVHIFFKLFLWFVLGVVPTHHTYGGLLAYFVEW